MVQYFGSSLGGWFLLGVSCEFSKSQLGLQSSEGLTGAGEAIPMTGHSYGQQLASPRANNPRNKGVRHNAFYDLALEVTHHYLRCTLLLTRTDLIPCGRRLHKGTSTKKQRSLVQARYHIGIILHVYTNSLTLLKRMHYPSDCFMIDRAWK